MIEAGIVFISTEPKASVTHLLPSTRTRVLPAPRFLNDISLEPSPPFVAVVTGRIPLPSLDEMLCKISPMLLRPVLSIAASEMISKGFELSKTDFLILEPVTITSSTSSSPAS